MSFNRDLCKWLQVASFVQLKRNLSSLECVSPGPTKTPWHSSNKNHSTCMMCLLLTIVVMFHHFPTKNPSSSAFSVIFKFFIIDRAGEFPRLDLVLAGPFRCISRVRGWEVGSHQFQELKCGAFLTWGAPKSSKIGHFQLENQWFTGLRFTQILRTSACVARSKHGFGSPYWGHRSI